jgi:putative endonuclease
MAKDLIATSPTKAERTAATHRAFGLRSVSSIRLAWASPTLAHGRPPSENRSGLMHRGTGEADALSGATRGSEVEGQLSFTNGAFSMSESGSSFVVYILRCADGAYYVGSATDVPARVAAHNAGRGPRFTARRRPVTLAHTECFDTMHRAREREMQIKRWTRAKKEALIKGDLARLHQLSRRKTR